jgi:photosystem II stability/assembly factor-like uncharacterized protein
MKKIYILMIAILIGNIAEAQWQQVFYNNCTSYSCWISTLGVSGNTIYASTSYAGVYMSSNNGISWNMADTGLQKNIVSSFAPIGNNVLAATSQGVFLSTNNSGNWNAINTGLTNLDVRALLINGSDIYAGTIGGIFKSSNNGNSWNAISTGLTDTAISSLAVNGNTIYAGTYRRGVFLSTNNGNNWSAINNGLSDTAITSLAISGVNIVAGTKYGKMFISSNNGNSWSNVFIPPYYPSEWHVSSFATIGNTVFAAIMFSGVYMSNDNGSNWTFANTGMLDSVNTLTICGNEIFAGTWVGLCKRPLSQLTEINKKSIQTNLFIFPNPATNSLTLNLAELKNLQNTTVSIYDIQGKLLLQQNRLQPQTELDISGFAKGIYIIKLINEKETMQSKFIKE